MTNEKHTKNNYSVEDILQKIKDWEIGDRLIVNNREIKIYGGYEIHKNMIYINYQKTQVQMSQQYFHYLENIDYYKRIAYKLLQTEINNV